MEKRRRVRLYVGLAVAVLAAGALAIPAFAGSSDAGTGAIEPAPAFDDETRRQFLDEATRFVSCMRTHGFDLGDPVASEQAVAVTLDGIDVADPSFRAAERACGLPLPDGAPAGSPGAAPLPAP